MAGEVKVNSTTISGDAQLSAEGTRGYVVAVQVVAGAARLYSGTSTAGTLIAGYPVAPGGSPLVFPEGSQPYFDNGLFLEELGSITSGYVHWVNVTDPS